MEACRLLDSGSGHLGREKIPAPKLPFPTRFATAVGDKRTRVVPGV
jgi:hypothetical protein